MSRSEIGVVGVVRELAHEFVQHPSSRVYFGVLNRSAKPDFRDAHDPDRSEDFDGTKAASRRPPEGARLEMKAAEEMRCERISSESGRGLERGKHLDRVFPISGIEVGSCPFVDYNDANLHLVRVFISV
jgi:hypothetical protein